MEVQWQVHKQNEEMQAKLLPFLPQDVNYKIKTFQLFHDSNIPLERQFYAEFEVNICQKEKFYEHFHDFCTITSTSWNKRRGKDMDNPTAPRRIFRGERKCHHNVRKEVSKVTGEMKKDEPERFVVDDEEVTLRPPPKKKAREQKRGHDLMASVAQNKPGSKKH